MYQFHLHKFTTDCEVTIYDTSLVQDLNTIEQQCNDLIDQIEQQCSRFLPTSDLYHLNLGETILPWYHLQQLMGITQQVVSQTYGRFHPMVSVMDLWYTTSFDDGFIADHTIQAQHTDILSTNLSDYRSTDDQGRMTLCTGYCLDCGGIGKWYTVDQLGWLLLELGCQDWMINFGGDILVHGSPDADEPFCIAIDDPRAPGTDIALLDITHWSISTSGSYKRRREVDGHSYHHIIDPSTGQNRHDIISVTIIGPDTATTDAFATAVMTCDVVSWLDLLERNGLDGLIIDAHHTIHMTPDFAARYNLE